MIECYNDWAIHCLAQPKITLVSRDIAQEILGDNHDVYFPLNVKQGGRPPYVYVFDHRPVYSRIPDWTGVVHAMDVGFVFGAPFKNIQDPFVNMMAMKYSEIEKGLSLYIMKLWTDFAKYG